MVNEIVLEQDSDRILKLSPDRCNILCSPIYSVIINYLILKSIF